MVYRDVAFLPDRLTFVPAIRRATRADVLGVAGLVAFALFMARWFFGSYAFDDSFVGYAIADNLLHGRGFAFDPGVRTLSTSAPLAPLAYAFVAWVVRADVVDVAQTFAALGYIVLGPAAYATFRCWTTPAASLAGALALVASPFVAMLWSHESLLALVACTLGTLALARGRMTPAAIAFGAAVLLRQESLAPVAAAAVAVWRRDGLVAAGRFLALALLPLGAWALYALPTFGTIFSRTMSVKIAMATYPGIASYARGVADYATACFRFSRADQTYDAAALYGALVAAALGCALAAGARPSRLAQLVAAASAVTVGIYVTLHVAFFAWFGVPIAILVALVVAAPLAIERSERNAALATSARVAALALLAANLGFATRVATGAFPIVELTGFFPGSHVRDSGYRALGALLGRLPGDAVIAYDEPGQLRYYSGRTILDYQGMTHPGAAAYLAMHHPEWTLQRYRPSYFLLDVDDRNVMLAPARIPWFARAYRDAWGVVRVDRRGTRSRFRLFRLERPDAIPVLPPEANS